ncbi:MAG: cadherin domain-containing protein [Fuerstiella sp.]
MKKNTSHDPAKIESLEPMILMSASAADISGTDGDDVLIAFFNGQTADGGDGNDVLIGVGGSNVLKGGDGSDRFITVSGENVIDGGDGDDTLQFLNNDVGEFDIIDRGNGIIEISNDQQKNYVSNVEAVQFLDALYLIDQLVDDNGPNHAPTIVDPDGSHIMVDENQTFVVDVNAEDLDGDDLTYAIAEGADSALFTIDPQTGELSFISAPDFENPGDENGDNVYDVTVVVSDGQSTVEKTLWVEVKDVNENGGNNAPFFTNVEEGEIVTVPENTTLVGDADGTDPDGDPVTYSIVGGADASLFSVNADTGVVSFVNAPDFETPGDADGNNDYQIRLRISDGSLFQDRNVTVRVTDREEGSNRAPFFTNVQQFETVWHRENVKFVGDADAIDPDGDTLIFSIVGGVDASKFEINSQTGELFFVNAPDFENPTDSNHDNFYELKLRVSDGQLSQDRLVYINVEDENDGNGCPDDYYGHYGHHRKHGHHGRHDGYGHHGYGCDNGYGSY